MELACEICALAYMLNMKELYNPSLQFLDDQISEHYGAKGIHDGVANELYEDLSTAPNLRQYVVMLMIATALNTQERLDSDDLSEREAKGVSLSRLFEVFCNGKTEVFWMFKHEGKPKTRSEEEKALHEKMKRAKAADRQEQFVKLVLYLGKKVLKHLVWIRNVLVSREATQAPH